MASSSCAEMSDCVRFIREQSLEKGGGGATITAKKKGIETLQKASIIRRRNDNTKFLVGKDQIRIHNAFSKSYSNYRRIEAYLHQGFHQAGPSTSSPLHLMSKDEILFIWWRKKSSGTNFWKQKGKVEMNGFRKLFTGTTVLVKECCINPHRLTGTGQGHSTYTEIDQAMECVYSFLEENSDECQFSFAQLMYAIEGECQVDRRTVKSRLLFKYGEDILFVETGNTSTVCFRNTGYKIPTQNWYENKKLNPQEERMRVVKAAADIIIADIRSKAHNSDIPASLFTLLETVILKNKKGSYDKWKRTCVAISHAVVAAARPRSFLSPILTGLSVFVYRKFGSKLLTNMMSSPGFWSSHTKAQLLEASSISQSQPPLIKPRTFHPMRGIVCMTPHDAVGQAGNVKLSGRMSVTEVVATAVVIELQIFVKNPNSGLKTVAIKDLDSLSSTATTVISQSAAELLWFYSKSTGTHLPRWNSFMAKASENGE
ncbi:hypothetical protein PR048_032182 [Dryococelus australis]|uniref:Uncharacterized protein n=1 Tax=Dryococelus australis TaxID=614101 RepID=A0ABQ9G5K8_9NEOP|nr:hypothetical protein PR048_032182 [Dryococelus australis]